MGIRIRMGSWSTCAGVALASLALLAATPAPSPTPVGTPRATAPATLSTAPPTKTADGLTFGVQTDQPASSGTWHCVFNTNVTLGGIFLNRVWLCTPLEAPSNK